MEKKEMPEGSFEWVKETKTSVDEFNTELEAAYAEVGHISTPGRIDKEACDFMSKTYESFLRQVAPSEIENLDEKFRAEINRDKEHGYEFYKQGGLLKEKIVRMLDAFEGVLKKEEIKKSLAITREVILGLDKERSENQEKLKELHANNLKRIIGDLRNAIKVNAAIPENIDVNPFYASNLEDKLVSKGVAPTSELGGIEAEHFDYEQPPFKTYYFSESNKLIWARLKEEFGKMPEEPDFNDQREASAEEWCKYAQLIALGLLRCLPDDLRKEKEIELSFEKQRSSR
jgi:hypothetical protein